MTDNITQISGAPPGSHLRALEQDRIAVSLLAPCRIRQTQEPPGAGPTFN